MSLALAARRAPATPYRFDPDAESPVPRRPRRVATRTPAGDAGHRLRQRRPVPRQMQRRRRAAGGSDRPGRPRPLSLHLKTDLREAYPFGLFAVPREQVLRLHASSGTTGRPTVVGYTRGDLDRWAGLMARCFATAGARPGDVIHNAYGYGLFTGGLGAHDGAQRLGATVVPASGGGTERQIVLLRDFGASVLCATPSYALNIAEVAEAQGVDLRGGPLRLGMFGAEPWSGGDARRARKRASGSSRAMSMACRRSWGRAWRWNARPPTACMAGKIISCSR